MDSETEEILWIAGAALVAYGLYRFATANGYSVPFFSQPSSPSPASPQIAPPTQTNSGTGTDSAMPNGNDADILTRTILGEARNQGEAGMEAVANVVINRYHDGGYPGGGSVAGICKAPNQFVCWNRNDSNYRYVISVQSSDPLYQEAYAIALRALNGSLADNTGGATYYHADNIPKPNYEPWTSLVQTAQIGYQTFYAPETASG